MQAKDFVSNAKKHLKEIEKKTIFRNRLKKTASQNALH